jgi:hypothetical protein
MANPLPRCLASPQVRSTGQSASEYAEIVASFTSMLKGKAQREVGRV